MPKKTTEQKYKKQTLLEHIQELPDTYIGSIEESTEPRYIYDFESNSIKKKTITYIPGLYKIYDEIIVNAVDQYVRLKMALEDDVYDKIYLVKNIMISINKDTGLTSVYNDGDGIDVAKHKTYDVFVPSLIFGELLTSSNYNKQEEKVTGGKNGYGAKLTNIFSKSFIIKTVDKNRNLEFTQEFRDNMSYKGKPNIKKVNKNPYTKISYIPDFEKFNIKGYTDDMIALMTKRAYDVAAWTDNTVNVYLNGKKLTTNTFEKYINLYLGAKKDNPRVYEQCNERWQIAAALNPEQVFDQVSFVNGIDTVRGGKHVDYVSNNITKKLIAYIKKKKKINVKPSHIKSNLIVFVKSSIINPSFDSQTKETLTTPINKFGSKCNISDKFIDKLAKSGVMERSIQLNQFKENNDLKKTDGTKKNRIRGIPKLDDANWAGTKKSKQCTLILTEGDSAKAMAVGGLGILGRDKWGVYPLKGKMLNVRGCAKTATQTLLKNKEINDIKKIMGLESDKVYKDINDLRYGKVMILTDQDEDGSHIKGLFFNMIEELWLELFKTKGFLVSMLTPIVKASKGKKTMSFYSLPDYDKWKNDTDTKGWKIKYYKGLGTSTPKEAKQYFKDMKMVTYECEEESNEMIDLAFNKKRSNDRKKWLQTYNNENVLNYNKKNVTFSDFINKDLIHFSNSDNIRSLPNVFDGLKPSQRKIIFCCIKRNLTKNEVKVAQLSGYVSEHGAYHHGEASLQGTIVNLAQNFIGSNNINLLEPIGQFGTRLQGGKDSAQPRYIHTKLTNLTQLIFNKLDNPLYNYLEDDGLSVEPEYYIPIIPMILVNGSQGIGTGWSTDIPSFNPIDIIKNIKRKMKGQEMIAMKPWYRGFTGKIEAIVENGVTKYITKGVYKIVNDTTVEITELPIKSWTDKYKELLETLIIDSRKNKKKQYINNYKTYCTDTNVHFIIKIPKLILKNLMKLDNNGIPHFDTVFKMRSKISMSNMNMYNKDLRIHQFKSPNDILDYYYDERLKLYNLRKDYILNDLNHQLQLISAKIRFILDFISNKLKISNVSKVDIISQLEDFNYPKLGTDINFGKYEYLIKMPIYNLTKDKIEELNKHKDDLEMKINVLSSKTNIDLWKDDLNEFTKQYKKIYKIKKKLVVEQ